jgi:hypothetical protein
MRRAVAGWHFARGGFVPRVRGIHVEGFVRSLIVELAAEAIEAELLRAHRGRRRTGGRVLQYFVHALVATILPCRAR